MSSTIVLFVFGTGACVDPHSHCSCLRSWILFGRNRKAIRQDGFAQRRKQVGCCGKTTAILQMAKHVSFSLAARILQHWLTIMLLLLPNKGLVSLENRNLDAIDVYR